MIWLSWSPSRRRPWTEHGGTFPKGAIRYRETAPWGRDKDPLLIFQVSDDRRTITEIPEDEWGSWL